MCLLESSLPGLVYSRRALDHIESEPGLYRIASAQFQAHDVLMLMST